MRLNGRAGGRASEKEGLNPRGDDGLSERTRRYYRVDGTRDSERV